MTLLLEATRQRGVAEDALVAGLPLRVDQIRDPRNRIAWDDFTVILENAERILGGPEGLVRVAQEHQGSPSFGFVHKVSQLLVSARDIYWMGSVWFGPALFSITREEFEELPGGHLRETIEIPPGYRDSPQFFRAMLGAIRSAPRHLGQPDAHVEMELHPRRAVYTITPPPPLTLWARLRRVLGSVVGARRAIEELSAQHRQLRESYAELAAAKAKVAAQAAQLQRSNREIRDHNALLEEQVVERKRSEAERRRLAARLLQARKLESLGIMAGGIAHDFGNLLVGVHLNVHAALAGLPPDSPGRAALHEIENATARAGELTDQLLACAGQRTRSTEPVDLSSLVEETARLLAGGVARGVRLELALDEDGPWIEADAGQIRQVAMNLIANGAEALEGEPGSVAIRTGTCWVDRQCLDECLLLGDLFEGEYAYFEVRDTGRGMDRDTQERIFDPFFTRKCGGAGLGLAVVLGIVRGHGGTVRVESAPRRGTTFRVYFPRLHAGKAVEVPVGVPLRLAGPVLLVGGEASVRTALARLLALRGVAVLTASSGAEAVAVLRERSDAIAAAVLDASIPDMDGADALRALRGIRPDLPVVVCIDSGEAGGDPFPWEGPRCQPLHKPFTLATLIEKVLRVTGS